MSTLSLLVLFLISLQHLISHEVNSFIPTKQPISWKLHQLQNNNNIRRNELNTIKIVYESDSILAIEKPPHIPHHDDDDSNENNEMGVISLIRQLQEQKEISYQGRLWGVHRLDRVTSGVLLLAKSKYVAQELSSMFREKKVIKYYIALSNKKPKKKKQGWVKGDMTQSRRKSWKLCNTFDNPAITRFFTAGLGNCDAHLQDFITSDDVASNESDVCNAILPKTMILFRPHTGKTHQLRVAAKSLGLPIVGDETYNDANVSKHVKRAYLHAVALHLELKKENDEIENVVICDPPTSWFYTSGESNGMDEVFRNIMKKHCESEDILDLID